MKRTQVFRAKNMEWHTWAGWTGGVALVLFALSGLLHILMTWTGPQAASFFPPQASFAADEIQAVPGTLAQHDLHAARMVKIVPSQMGALLQVTVEEAEPRRYFDLTSGAEIVDHDGAQAIWLARYYSGEMSTPVRQVVHQTTFDHAYPWVNRLLPVYRVEFETDDNLTAFIHTEFGALGNLTNDWKSGIQAAFAVLHTWSWLESVEGLRLVSMMVLLTSLFALAATGTAMIFLLQNRTMPAKRRWHRLIAYGTWVPILLFTVSGTYHLFQMNFDDREQALVHGPKMQLGSLTRGDAGWASDLEGIAVNAVTILPAPDGSLVYRIGLPQGRPGKTVDREARYRGVALEQSSLYISPANGDVLPLTDRDMAVHVAALRTGRASHEIEMAEMVTRFGADYDFRNKRLPVWRIDFPDERIFVDPATGVQVDRIDNVALAEAYTFSILHKWNLLVPLIGRLPRDLLLLAVLLPALAASVLGYALLLRRRRSKPVKPR